MRAPLALAPIIALLLTSCEGDVYRLDRGAGSAVPDDPLVPPSAYRDFENPFAGDADAEAAGALAFGARCASCHGDDGRGGGPRAARLDPAPADLAALSERSDGYLLWRIEEGAEGVPFESAMPAFGGVLTEDEAWQVITFLRSLAPRLDDDGAGDVDPEPTTPSAPGEGTRAPPSEPPTS